jgi:ABC-type transport system involved in multi-copper enzyme maturation permease subunit
MKGLLLKDFLSLKNYIRTILIVLIAYALFSFFGNNISMLMVMFALFSAMLPVTTFFYDEQAKWDKYALSHSVERRTVVLSKYVFALLILVVGELIALGVVSILGIIKPEMALTGSELLSLAAVGVFYAGYLNAILIPLIHRYGTEKARMMMIMILFLPAILIFIFKDSFSALLDPAVLTKTIIGLGIGIIAAIAISINISIRIYARKEF